MTRGLPLFLVICLLATAPLYSRTLGQVAVGVLFALWILTLTNVKASADRRSRDATQATEGKVN